VLSLLTIDKAVELFQSGLKLAQLGYLEAASNDIATAYLLDARSFSFCWSYPHPEDVNVAMDEALMRQLLNRSRGSTGSSCTVIYMMVAQVFGCLPSR